MAQHYVFISVLRSLDRSYHIVVFADANCTVGPVESSQAVGSLDPDVPSKGTSCFLRFVDQFGLCIPATHKHIHDICINILNK